VDRRKRRFRGRNHRTGQALPFGTGPGETRLNSFFLPPAIVNGCCRFDIVSRRCRFGVLNGCCRFCVALGIANGRPPDADQLLAFDTSYCDPTCRIASNYINAIFSFAKENCNTGDMFRWTLKYSNSSGYWLIA